MGTHYRAPGLVHCQIPPLDSPSLEKTCWHSSCVPIRAKSLIRALIGTIMYLQNGLDDRIRAPKSEPCYHSKMQQYHELSFRICGWVDPLRISFPTRGVLSSPPGILQHTVIGRDGRLFPCFGRVNAYYRSFLHLSSAFRLAPKFGAKRKLSQSSECKYALLCNARPHECG